MPISVFVARPTAKKIRGFSMVEVLIVVAVTIIISILALPSLQSMGRNYRSVGDGQDLFALVGLAKMRAAANFTHSRVYADLSSNSVHIELWNTTSSVWTNEGTTTAGGSQ